MEKPREIAIRILRRYAEQADYLENLLADALSRSSLSAVDRGLVQELTFGIVRWQSTLDWLIARKTDGRAQPIGLQMLLRLGLYQIFWLERIPPHAAVHETVELAKGFGFSGHSGFLNAVLRGYLREQTETKNRLRELQSGQPALGYSHPEWLVERWRKRWDDEKTRALLEWNNAPPPTFARLNALKTTAAKLSEQWQQEGVQFIARHWEWTGEGLVFELKSHPPLTTLPSFQQGLFYVQDPSTLLAVQELNPQPGDSILDLCAAPGGKTTFIAQRLQNRGRIAAQDVSQTRLDLVRENCARLGVTCVEMSLLAVPPPLPSPKFEKILVDAPCSNTGVMRRRVDVRWRIRPEEIERLRRIQLDLLERAVVQLKNGGTLVYSTCSLEPEENSTIVEQFLAAHPGLRLKQKRTVLPFVEAADGAYVATFVGD